MRVPFKAGDKIRGRPLNRSLLKILNRQGYLRDPYIARKEAKSIACIPVQLQNVPVGVLYLENNAVPGVFTDQRLEPLEAAGRADGICKGAGAVHRAGWVGCKGHFRFNAG